jgi:hypothetical protein
MQLKPEELEANGYVLMDKLDHLELIPFVRKYINTRTIFSTIYMVSNLLVFAAVGYFLIVNWQRGTFTMGEGLTHLCYGLAIAFALLPVHEYIHVLAYKSQGAQNTSYDANLKKFYFLAVADKFVANKKEFQIVALAPFVIITSMLLVFLIFTGPLWKMTVLGALLTHTAFCSGDFGLLSYFAFHKDKEVVTFDDKATRVSYFFGIRK